MPAIMHIQFAFAVARCRDAMDERNPSQTKGARSA